MRMLNGKLLVRKNEAPKESKSGLVFTSDQGIKSSEGTVITPDPDSNLEVGDVVLFSEYAGADVIVDEEKYLILEFEDLWGMR